MDTNKDNNDLSLGVPEIPSQKVPENQSQIDPIPVKPLTPDEISKLVLANLKLQRGIKLNCLDCTCKVSIMNTIDLCPLHTKEVKRRTVQKKYTEKHKKEKKKESKSD